MVRLDFCWEWLVRERRHVSPRFCCGKEDLTKELAFNKQKGWAFKKLNELLQSCLRASAVDSGGGGGGQQRSDW